MAKNRNKPTAIPSDNHNEEIEQAFKILDEVNLEFFKATPEKIGAFGVSMLSWKVTGPLGFFLQLNGINVAKTGTRAVQPINTFTYTLTAVARQARRILGSVRVEVIAIGCQSNLIGNPKSVIEANLKRGVLESEGSDFRDGNLPDASFSPGRIHFKMELVQSVVKFPDPDVDIDVSFSLKVEEGVLVPFNEQISVDISFPWYAWLIPGAFIGLSVAIDMAEEEVKKKMHNAVVGLAELFTFFATFPDGLQLRTVEIDKDEANGGSIEVTACPNNLLSQFADISGAVIIQ